MRNDFFDARPLEIRIVDSERGEEPFYFSANECFGNEAHGFELLFDARGLCFLAAEDNVGVADLIFDCLSRGAWCAGNAASMYEDQCDVNTTEYGLRSPQMIVTRQQPGLLEMGIMDVTMTISQTVRGRRCSSDVQLSSCFISKLTVDRFLYLRGRHVARAQ